MLTALRPVMVFGSNKSGTISVEGLELMTVTLQLNSVRLNLTSKGCCKLICAELEKYYLPQEVVAPAAVFGGSDDRGPVNFRDRYCRRFPDYDSHPPH